MSRRLLLFSKRPRAGTVKTRLVPTLSPHQALALYRAFLRDQLAFARSLAIPGLEVELSTVGPWDPGPEWRDALLGVRCSEQGPGDLGQRMLRAFRRAADDGCAGAVIIAVDSPTLPADRVRRAFEALDGGAAAVVSPARDGGYVLLGMAEPRLALLSDVPWGGSRVLAVTRARATESGTRLDELPGWYDVDDPSGLASLRRELADARRAARAPATAACLDGLFPAA